MAVSYIVKGLKMNLNRFAIFGFGIMLASGMAHAELLQNVKTITYQLLRHPHPACQAYGRQSQAVLDTLPRLPDHVKQAYLTNAVHILDRAEQLGCFQLQ